MNTMKLSSIAIATLLFATLVASCGDAHDHANHADHDDHVSETAATEDDHAHAEESLGSCTIGDLNVELAQGHGGVVAGAEAHLVVKLPYKDDGATIVRAWIGTSDRATSYVGKGQYAPAHDDYDIHATAPSPLPSDTQWWIEIEKPDGTKAVGSANPIMK